MKQAKRYLLALLLIAMVAVAACAPPGPLKGRVTDATYDDPDDWTTTYCVAYIKNICAAWGTQYHHDDEHFWLYLKNAENGKEGWREVNQSIYHDCVIGSWCDVRTGRFLR